MGHNAYSRYSLEYHQHNPLFVENVNAWGVSKYYDFFVKGATRLDAIANPTPYMCKLIPPMWPANQSGPLQK